MWPPHVQLTHIRKTADSKELVRYPVHISVVLSTGWLPLAIACEAT